MNELQTRVRVVETLGKLNVDEDIFWGNWSKLQALHKDSVQRNSFRVMILTDECLGAEVAANNAKGRGCEEDD